MNSNLKFPIFALVAVLALAACSSPTSAATPAVPETEVLAASATVSVPTIEVPTTTSTSLPLATESPIVAGGISFANDVLPIFQSRCANCHGTNNPREGLVVITYDGLMVGSKNGPVVTPGEPDNSQLIKMIKDGEMPKRGPKLTPEQLQILIDWILQGALDN